MTARRSTGTIRKAVLLLIPMAGSLAAASTGSGAPAQAPDLRFVVFGTSLTAGDEWPRALTERLGACLGQPVALQNLAKSGENSNWGLRHIDEVAAQNPDLVTIEFSANDAALHNLITFSRSQENIRAMVRRLRQTTKTVRIVLMAMNPMHGLRGRWLRPRLDTFYDSYVALAAELGVAFVDHRPAWNGMSKEALFASIPDGVHPREDAAARIIVPTLLKAIAPDCPPGQG